MPSVVKWLVLVGCALMPCVSLAQQDSAEQARSAMNTLAQASKQLEEAGSARDRVSALTKTVEAFEEGLSALRTGLRQAAVREQYLSVKLQAQDAEIASLLAVLQQISTRSTPTPLMHPGGPTGAARAGMLLAEMTPALNGQAADLRRDLLDLQKLREIQTDAVAHLNKGLRTVQDARSALSLAIADRTDLPQRFIQDPVREAILIASAQTLDSFAKGLDQVVLDVAAPAPVTLEGNKGNLAMPVRGIVLRNAGEADAAGINRPGMIIATRPQAIVTTPVSGTIRYTGPLLDLGQVVILEPQANVLFVLAGLETVYGLAGEVVNAGAPLGLMGDSAAKNRSELSTDGDDTGAERSETLYIEVRQDNAPEDPSLWFRTDKDG